MASFIRTINESECILQTYTCVVCDSSLTGSSGRQCDNCGICCHDICIKLADDSQRCKDVYTAITDVNGNQHLWVKGVER